MIAAAALSLCCAAGLSAQTYTVLHNFAGIPADGAWPEEGVVSDGKRLYGTTGNGGEEGMGTVYAVNLDGSGYSILHAFDPASDGTYPNSELALAGGVLYGTTRSGGEDGCGVIYSIKTNASGYKIIHHFAADLWSPGPVTAAGGTLYGVVEEGGTHSEGIAYSIKTDGTAYTVLHEFAGSPSDGAMPVGKLLLEKGVLYGATALGGKYFSEGGTLFSMADDGSDYRVLYDFSGEQTSNPCGGLISNGSRLFGFTNSGQEFFFLSSPPSVVFSVAKDGTDFTILHAFEEESVFSRGDKEYRDKPSTDASFCTGLVLQGTTLYGTVASLGMIFAGSSTGGGFDPGAIFSLDAAGGGYAVVHRFDGLIGGTGSFPSGTPLLLKGTLYGTAPEGGSEHMGVVYSCTLPSPPPIDLTPNKRAFFTTDWIAVRADVAAIPVPCIPFVRIITPSGQELYCEQGKGFTEIPIGYLGFPGVVIVASPISDYPIFDTQFRGMPKGTYYLEGGAIDPVKTTDLSNPVYIGNVDSEILTID
jgi:uncharacterized repeat protein (TIGR03803 family)